jgi:hypothetical protein
MCVAKATTTGWYHLDCVGETEDSIKGSDWWCGRCKILRNEDGDDDLDDEDDNGTGTHAHTRTAYTHIHTYTHIYTHTHAHVREQVEEGAPTSCMV